MKAIIFAAALFALPAVSFAASGGEGSQTGCNGQGNPNSPCEGTGGGGGGTPGTPGSVTNITNNNNITQTARARASARASAQQQQTATGGAASATGGSVTVNNTTGASGAGGNAGNRTVTVRNVPDIYAPPIGGGSNPCVVGASGGVGGPGWGFSLGLTTNDAGCERRNVAIVLSSMGEHAAAIEVLCADRTVREALNRANRPCAEDRPREVVAPAPQVPTPPTPPRNVPAFCNTPGLQVHLYPECR